MNHHHERQGASRRFSAGVMMTIATRNSPTASALSLQERRTALISAAVTGKIDVREFVSQEVT